MHNSRSHKWQSLELMVPFRAKTLRNDVILSKNSTKEQLLSASQIHKLIHSHTEWREKFLCYFFVQLRNSCYPRKVVLRRLTSRSVETVPKQSAVFATLTNEGKKLLLSEKAEAMSMEETVCAARAVWGEKKKRTQLCVNILKYPKYLQTFALCRIYSTMQRSSEGYECAP